MINKNLCSSDIIDKIPKSRLLSKLGFNCQCIPPIEEACNSLQKFLQDDFPKLIKEINDSVLLSTNSSVNSDNLENSENERGGRFSVLPVSLIEFLKLFTTLYFYIFYSKKFFYLF